MEISKFIKLEKEFGDKSFEAKYKLIDIILTISSYLGNIASIFFAYFFFYQLLIRSTSDFIGKSVLFGITAIITLSIFELLKRYVLKGMCFAVISNKKFNLEVIYNLLFSIILFCSSFYLTIHGAKIFSDNTDKIQIETRTTIARNIDSLDGLFNNKIEYKITERDGLIKNRDIYNEKIKYGQTNNRLKQYSELIKQANSEIQRIDKEIDRLRNEHSIDISNIKKNTKSDADVKINEVFKNQRAFIIISSFIELLILIGIWFNAMFKFNIYNEFKNNINSNQSYKTYLNYSTMLNILYQNGKVKYGNTLPSMTAFINIVRNKENFSHAYIKNFILIIKDLGIVSKDIHHKNIAAKQYSEAKEIMIDFFNS